MHEWPAGAFVAGIFGRPFSVKGFGMSYSLSFAIFLRIMGVAFLIVVMGYVVDRWLTRRHYKRANG